jgi:lipopolysaccharide/colanic/teichoic acid biosynthesis glycosyltransferase
MSIQLLDREKVKSVLTHDSEPRSAFAKGFYANYGKRALDLLLATAGLILLLPLFGVVAGCIKLTSRGPIFFRQLRIGQNGRPFRIVKFRTMSTQTSHSDLAITVARDPRVTVVGGLLRSYKVDELPQLWNVIRGEMSLVGPRPEVPFYVAGYTPEQRAVLSARPGITDPASLTYRNEEQILAAQKDPEKFYRAQVLPDKLSRNRVYLENITFSSDVSIILETIASSIFCVEKRPRGARSK